MTEPRTRKDAEVLMLRAEVEKVSAERDAMRTALSSVRKAAGSGRDMTNRLQFIYARAGAAIDGLPWDDSWKAEHGYTMRDRTLRENDLLRQEVERLRAELQTCRNKLKASGRTKLREDNAALRALLRRWYEEYAGSTWPRGGPVDAQLDADTARALGEGK